MRVRAGWLVEPMTPDELDDACRVIHDAYERAAVGAGWSTNVRSRRPWAEVPEANKAAMRAGVRALVGWLADCGVDVPPRGEVTIASTLDGPTIARSVGEAL